MKKTFIILANASWNSGGIGGNSSQQYAQTLMRLGFDVAYVEPSGVWSLKSQRDLIDPDSTIVMCDFPYLEHYRDIFFDHIRSGCQSVCRIVDYWKEMETTDIFEIPGFNLNVEAEIIKAADCVFASSPLNIERLKGIRKNVGLLRNGVDLSHFSTETSNPNPAIPKGRVTLGIVSSFWTPCWVDLAPVLEYAYSHPEDRINIIGDISRVIDPKELPANIICHGPKPWKDLPGYMRQFDVGVVPYNPQTTKYTNPIKVLEYLACGKPVVSQRNISIQDYPYVYFYQGPKSFEAAVTEAVTHPIDNASLRNFLQQQTWEKKIKKILGQLESARRLTCSVQGEE